MKKFKLSPYKFALDCASIFFAAAFFTFYISFSWTDNILRVTGLEVLASLGIGFSLSVLYAVLHLSLKKDREVTVTENALLLDGRTKRKTIPFGEIKSIDVSGSFLYSLIRTSKIRIEAQDYCQTLYIEKKRLEEFLSAMPAEIYSPVTAHLRAQSFFTGMLIELLRSTFVFLIGGACILPAALDMVRAKDQDSVWLAFSVIYLTFFVLSVLFFIAKRIIYSGHKYEITGGRLYVESGSIVKRKYYLSKDNITAVTFSHNFFSRLFNMYRIKLTTKGGGKGIIETDYFPFMMHKARALEIMRSFAGNEAVCASLEKPERKSVLPVLVLWLIPVIAVIAISFLGSFLWLLLCVPIALFITVTYKNSAKGFSGGHYILQKGFFNTSRIFLPINKIERVNAVMTVTCRLTKMTFIEIYLSGYRAVVFGGYYYKSDFDNFLKKINELG